MLRHTIALLLLASPVVAQEGVLNPQEMSMEGMIDRMRHGDSHPMMGMVGYGAAKAGLHEEAREIFEKITGEGNVQGITWLSWMEDNGLSGRENPDRAAELDRRAAEAGSAVGMFNYGLDLMRGRGVVEDQAAGRAMIDRAAAAGDRSAQHLIEQGYDIEAVTPDADNWKYEKRLF
ncbi:tetratricopeptide repeat protein [Sagittula sp. S175]|uniref:tetratricopeptide repeat protein n=1 Tax=Sagittula sp. S175 TaxID=3415129 RepID=UPI003C7CDA4B